MSKLFYLSDETFKAEVLTSDKPVLVDFYADWCGPCQMIGPMLEDLAVEVEGIARVAKVDIDANGETAAEHGIQSIPTLILFKDGQPVERWTGVVPKEELLKGIHEHSVSASAAAH
jgi:thioredoxin 1